MRETSTRGREGGGKKQREEKEEKGKGEKRVK
jgi:hypothetical protein